MDMFTEAAKVAIKLFSSLQLVRHPNHVVDNKPSKKHAFWRGPILPDRLHKFRVNQAPELDLVG